MTPFLAATSRSLCASRTAWVAVLSPPSMADRAFLRVVRSALFTARFRMVRLTRWRLRLTAEVWLAIEIDPYYFLVFALAALGAGAGLGAGAAATGFASAALGS